MDLTGWLLKLAWLLLLLGAAGGCAVNPVTGKQELQLVSETTEIQLGAENYLPAQQSQGGPYAVDAELGRYVSEVGQRLAQVSDRPDLPYEFTVLNNSVPNAWALPGGKIAINRGLLTRLGSEAELAAVLGHEIVHAAARHGAKSMERGMIAQAGVAAIGVAAQDQDLAGLIVGGAALGAQLVQQKYGRDAELESDYYGMQYMARAGYDPAAAISLQQTFVELSKGHEQGWLDGLFASHPPSPERVETNRATAAKLPANLKRGEAEYRERIGTLLRTEKAYALHDRGRDALAKGDAEAALKLANQAIEGEPREALFYGLRGDAYQMQKRFKAAEAEYGEALARNDRYFLFYLQRGLVRQRLDDPNGAQSDLEMSRRLLPTTTAEHALGSLALARNDQAAAIEHFTAAAASDSPTGRQAAIALARLDLPRRPQHYLEARLGADAQGRIVIGIANHAPLAVRDIELVLRDGTSGTVVEQLRIAGPLAAGTAGQVLTQLHASPAMQGVRIEVRAAALAE